MIALTGIAIFFILIGCGSSMWVSMGVARQKVAGYSGVDVAMECFANMFYLLATGAFLAWAPLFPWQVWLVALACFSTLIYYFLLIGFAASGEAASYSQLKAKLLSVFHALRFLGAVVPILGVAIARL